MIRVLLVLLLLAPPLYAQRVLLDARAGNGAVSLSTPALPAATQPVHAQLWPLLEWRRAQRGIAWCEAELWAGALRLPLRVILLRIDPHAVELQLLQHTRANGMTAAWNVDSAASDVAFAMNAGQFKETGPWGWLVLQGREVRAPGFGPLSAAIAIDTAGALHWFLPSEIPAARTDRAIRYAFQSYPLLIFDGRVPAMVSRSKDVDRQHRDARLILLQRADGTLVVALTRYDALGSFAARVPIGLTVPESVVLAAALGARHAIMLDGGISAQMLLRSETEGTLEWKGLRDVPLALYGREKTR